VESLFIGLYRSTHQTVSMARTDTVVRRSSPRSEIPRSAASQRWPPPSALTKFPNGAQRFLNGRPVGPNLQLNAEPLGSVEAEREATEPQRTLFPLGFSTPWGGGSVRKVGLGFWVDSS